MYINFDVLDEYPPGSTVLEGWVYARGQPKCFYGDNLNE